MTNIEELLLEVEQQVKHIHKQVHKIRLELAHLKHSNKAINNSKETVYLEDDQNRTTARRQFKHRYKKHLVETVEAPVVFLQQKVAIMPQFSTVLHSGLA